LKRYLVEFDFHYNERSALDVTDAERTAKAIAGRAGNSALGFTVHAALTGRTTRIGFLFLS
jgi:hypothetical protein